MAFTASTTQSEIPNFDSKSSTETQQETVIICRGEQATKYHSTSTSCRGLNNCKGGISLASKSHAIGSGKSSCSISYKDYQPSSNNYQRSTTPQNHATSVIICGGGQHATKYHRSTSCQGLNNCKKGLYEISKNGAINRGKSPCSICY